MSLRIRKANSNDIELIISFIKELAVYEKMLDEVETNLSLVEKWVFKKKIAHVLLAYLDNEPVGFLLYFFNYSTFVGKAGIYIEDLYVKEEHRGKKIGFKLFKKIASIAIKNDLGRIEWSCLKWNEPSIKFYEKLGAFPMEEWDTYRLTREKIEELAHKKNSK